MFLLSQDELRTQKETRQKNTLEAVNNSVKLLNEMLAHFSPEDSTDGDKEIIRVGILLDKTEMTFLNTGFSLKWIDLSENIVPTV